MAGNPNDTILSAFKLAVAYPAYLEAHKKGTQARHYFAKMFLLFFLMGASVGATIWGAVDAPDEFFFLLSVELFGGIATFTIFLLLDVLPARFKILSRAIAGLAALGCGIAAKNHQHEPLLRHLLLELSVGIVLAVVLETWIKHAFESMNARFSELEAQKDAALEKSKTLGIEFDKRLKEAESKEVAPKADDPKA